MVLNILLCVELSGPGCQQRQLWVRAPASVTESVLKKGGCGGGGHEGFRQSRSVVCPNICLLRVCRPHGNGERPPHLQVSEGGSVETGGDGGPGEMGPVRADNKPDAEDRGERAQPQ